MQRPAHEHQPLLSSVSHVRPDDEMTPGTRRRATVVLPAIVVVFFSSYMVTIVLANPYIYDIVAKDYPEFNSTSQSPCEKNMSGVTLNTTGRKIQEEIVKRVSTIELYLILTSFLVAALPILIIGPAMDRYGRKIGFIFPITGTMLRQVAYIVVIYKSYSPYWLLIGHFCDGIGGSFAGMITAIFSVISDITVPGKQRSFRITITEALQTISASVGQIVVAQWIKVNYRHPALYGLGLSSLCLLLTIFALPETSRTPRLVAPVPGIRSGFCLICCKGTWKVLTSCLQMIKKSFTMYTRDVSGGKGGKRLGKRRIVIAVFTLTVAVNFSLPGVQILYLMKYPLCWGATKLLTFGGVSMICNWVAILILLTLMQRIFNMTDRHVAIIGVVSSAASCLFMSLAVNDVMVYEVAVLNIMTRSIIPMLRSVITSLADPTDQGAVYAGMGCIETIGASLFSLTANRIFYVTLATWAGLIFALFACLMVIALVLLIVLNVKIANEQQSHSQSNQPINGHYVAIQEEPDPSW
ncbi:unnamed protein product [Lymnaea stagnalis]|uniref:Major facilitator superfamily (MFS) profile domain-containing protein n=1 Tax=Lymnaea stagnalis TaxID=6523 RepID=A0AAV2HVG1_LYMST